MPRCCLCAASSLAGPGAALDAGWRFAELRSAGGTAYRVYCPDHDDETCLDDLASTWRARVWKSPAFAPPVKPVNTADGVAKAARRRR